MGHKVNIGVQGIRSHKKSERNVAVTSYKKRFVLNKAKTNKQTAVNKAKLLSKMETMRAKTTKGKHHPKAAGRRAMMMMGGMRLRLWLWLRLKLWLRDRPGVIMASAHH